MIYILKPNERLLFAQAMEQDTINVIERNMKLEFTAHPSGDVKGKIEPTKLQALAYELAQKHQLPLTEDFEPRFVTQVYAWGGCRVELLTDAADLELLKPTRGHDDE